MRSSSPGSDNPSLCIASGYRQFCPGWMARVLGGRKARRIMVLVHNSCMPPERLSELGDPLVWITELNCELLRLHAPDLDRAPFRTKIGLSRAVLEGPQGSPPACPVHRDGHLIIRTPG